MPSRYDFHWLDVFTQQPYGGNQLVVFSDARGLTDAQMATIAREFNISETVFLLPPETPEGTRKVRIFTPARELPFAGHPTIGAAHILATRLLQPAASTERTVAASGPAAARPAETMLVLEEPVGLVRVAARPQPDGGLFLQLSAARPPEFRHPTLDLAKIAPVLQLDVADFETDLPGGMASCGTPFLIVPVRDTDALRRARIDAAQWERVVAAGAIGGITDTLWTDHVYLITRDDSLRERNVDFRVRMFAPGMGITEDAATGAAATAFAAHLAAFTIEAREGTFAWRIEQGIEMKRPSALYLEADKHDGNVSAVRVGGYAVAIGEGHLLV